MRALTRTITEARHRLADMLILCDPRHHVVADITRLTRGETVETYDGTTGDVFARVNDTVINDIDEPVPYAGRWRWSGTSRSPLPSAIVVQSGGMAR